MNVDFTKCNKYCGKHYCLFTTEYEKTMQKSWADVAEDETRNTL